MSLSNNSGQDHGYAPQFQRTYGAATSPALGTLIDLTTQVTKAPSAASRLLVMSITGGTVVWTDCGDTVNTMVVPANTPVPIPGAVKTITAATTNGLGTITAFWHKQD